MMKAHSWLNGPTSNITHDKGIKVVAVSFFQSEFAGNMIYISHKYYNHIKISLSIGLATQKVGYLP